MIETPNDTGGRRRSALLAALATVVAVLFLAPTSALAAAQLQLSAERAPETNPVAQGTYLRYELAISNDGDAATSGGVRINLSVPAGLKITGVDDEINQLVGFPFWDCTIAGDSQSVSCLGPDGFGFFGGPSPISAGSEACKDFVGLSCHLFVIVRAEDDAPLGAASPATITACGGGVSTCPTPAATAADDPIAITPHEFEVTRFDGKVLDVNGDPATQAGSHPYTAGTDFRVNWAMANSGLALPIENFQDVLVKLPPGLVGNPTAYVTCTQAQMSSGAGVKCPPESQVGKVEITGFPGLTGSWSEQTVLLEASVFNMQRPKGLPALFSFNILGTAVQVYPELRTGQDYGLDVLSKNTPRIIPLTGVDFTFWGVPGDPAHTPERACPGLFTFGCAGADPAPFISLPTSCMGPVETFLELTSWQGGFDGSSFLSHDNTEPVPNPIGADGCNTVPFEPSIQARPTTTVADAPSGLDVDLHIPQSEGCEPGPPVACEAATAHLRDTTVTLPEGLVINPSGANGLGTCSLAAFGYTSTDPDGTIHTTPDPANCPNASRLARVEVESPLIDHVLQGSAFLADPYQNPFGSLLALYVAIEDPQTGTIVKLAGKVNPDPQTGRLSATFERNPQLPFEHFRLHFFGGAGGSLRTPAVCGEYTATSQLTPWTAPEGQTATPSDSWAIQQGPAGACPTSQGARAHSPSFDAGAVSPIAGVHSPFVVNLRREDASQEFAAVTVSPPPGLSAKLAGTAPCPEAALAAATQKSGRAEEQGPSCPAASLVGSVVASAGAGPAPYHAPGKAYLSGPYKGAPLSLAIVTPATAGPFDLGTIVVRTALHVDPKTAQITAVSDPIPHILEGIPLDVRAVQIKLDRPEFTLNPTSCDPMQITGSLLSTLGQSAPLANRFQVGECGRLGFKPRMRLALKGGTKRGKHPALTAVLEPRAGDSNIASLSVALPPSEFLDQANIGTVCTRVQWAADQCPAASVYGTARVSTPLIAEPLVGNVYLRSSDNKLPDLVPDLRGPAHLPIRIESAGRTDTLKGGLRNSFEFVPDAPFSRLVVTLMGGPGKGLLVNSRNVCAKPYRATVKATAHNGQQAILKPKLRARCSKSRKAKGKQRKPGRPASRGR
jgi:hypothetical protein